MDCHTWVKYRIMRAYVERMTCIEKRAIFHLMINCDSSDTFMPTIGLTFGEFAVWQLLIESNRKRVKEKCASRVLTVS